MIKSKAVRKIFTTTLCLFIVLVVSTIPNIYKNNSLKVNLEVEDVTGLTNHSVYLLSRDGYLAKKKIFIDSEKMEDKVKKVLSYLMINSNSKYSSNLKGLIPKATKILDVYYDEFYVTVNFSREIEESKNLDLTVTAIVYSIIELGEVKGVSILVDGKSIEGYPYIMDKKMDINKETSITSRDEISKVVVYYLLEDNKEVYYVPVTKYLNDDRDKITIIIDELTLGFNHNQKLMSFLNEDTKLVSSNVNNKKMNLEFNSYIFDDVTTEEILEEVIYTICLSAKDNYDIEEVILTVNNKEIYKTTMKSLETKKNL